MEQTKYEKMSLASGYTVNMVLYGFDICGMYFALFKE
jgi:hypothetical protein